MKKRLLAPALALIAVNNGAAAQAAGPAADTREWPQLHTPDVVTPAVVPYLACLYAERGLPALRGSDGALIAYDKSGNGCSAARARALTDAAKLLEEKSTPDGSSPLDFAQRTISDIDAYVASLPNVGEGGVAIGVPLTIEDEVQPMYERYDGCLRAQINESGMSPQTVIGRFAQALIACKAVRHGAVADATAALAKKGWDAGRSSTAAANTFAKIDEAWLAIGQQYRAMLLRKTAGATKPTAKPATDGKHR